MKDQNDSSEPTQHSVHLDLPVEEAYRLFSEEFGKWWPLSLGPGSPDSGLVCGGAVTAWNPPHDLAFTWDPGGSTEESQSVAVQFQEDAGGTRVILAHRGWQIAGTAVCTSHTAESTNGIHYGLAISWLPNWKPVAIGRESGASGSPSGPIGFGDREMAWRNAARPTWAEVFLSCFAAFAAEHRPATI